MSLQLTGQQELQEEIQGSVKKLLDSLQLRKDVWDKIDYDAKKRWILQGKDPLITTSWDVYLELKQYFEELDHA